MTAPSSQPSHRPRKRFGQHFLADRGVVARILDAVAPQPGDRMVEIGPGQGALTLPLLQRVQRLDAVELDRDLVAELRARFAPERLTVHSGDALQFDFAALGGELRIIGNLPYNISTPLLFHLAGFAAHCRDLHFMLQKEVVERMVAAPSTPAYGRLSVMLQDRFDMHYLFEVPPGSFHPPPKVDSAVVRLVPLGGVERSARGAAQDPAMFARVVSHAFGMRRKTLRNALAGLLNADELRSVNVDPGLRAEQLPLAAFSRIADFCSNREKPG